MQDPTLPYLLVMREILVMGEQPGFHKNSRWFGSLLKFMRTGKEDAKREQTASTTDTFLGRWVLGKRPSKTGSFGNCFPLVPMYPLAGRGRGGVSWDLGRQPGLETTALRYTVLKVVVIFGTWSLHIYEHASYQSGDDYYPNFEWTSGFTRKKWDNLSLQKTKNKNKKKWIKQHD